MKIRNKRFRERGVTPNDFELAKDFLIGTSFTLGEDDISDQNNSTGEEDENKARESDSFFDHFIICQHNKIYLIWRGLVIFSCLTSSYFYAYMAAFENPHPGTFLYKINMVYEIIFLISLISNFLVEYQDEGMPKPVRDISKICWRYLKGQFLFDFIPLVPF